MRKVKKDNSDFIQYLETVKELKNHITIEEYRNEYRRLRSDDIPWSKVQKFKSEHTELRRLDKKRESFIEFFIDELNPSAVQKLTRQRNHQVILIYLPNVHYIVRPFQKRVMMT